MSFNEATLSSFSNSSVLSKSLAFSADTQLSEVAAPDRDGGSAVQKYAGKFANIVGNASFFRIRRTRLDRLLFLAVFESCLSLRNHFL